MKILKPLIALLVVLAIAFFVLPDSYKSYALGKYYDLTGDSGQAAASYGSAAESDPENITFAQAHARILNDMGEELKEETYFNQAFDIADKWIETNSTHDKIYLMYIELARAEWGKTRKTGAKVAIDKAVNLNPTDYNALVYQGIIYRDIFPSDKEIRKSIPIFEQAISARNSTNTYWANYELASAWWKLKDEARALSELDQCLSQFPPRWLREDAERLKQEIQSGGRTEK